MVPLNDTFDQLLDARTTISWRELTSIAQCSEDVKRQISQSSYETARLGTVVLFVVENNLGSDAGVVIVPSPGEGGLPSQPTRP
jgi:hypothetical protein